MSIEFLFLIDFIILFFQPHRWNYFCKTGIKNYYLYGSGSSADKDKLIIDKVLPNMKCIGYIDGLKSGFKEDLPDRKSVV